MKRKINLVGSNTLTVSLPTSWIRKNNLKKGDEIDVIEDSNRLILGGSGEINKKKSVVILNNNKQWLRTLLSSYYRQGFYELSLEFKEKQPIKLVQETVRTLKGYDIISHGNNTCVIRDITKDSSESSLLLVTKLFQQVNLLYGEVRAIVLGENTEFDIQILREDIMKSRDYLQRKIKIENVDYSYELYVLVHALEKIAGEYYHLSGEKYSKDQLSNLSRLNEHLKEASSVFNKMDFSKSSAFYLDIRNEMSHYDESVTSKNKNLIRLHNTEIIILHNLLTIASRLQIITGLIQENFEIN